MEAILKAVAPSSSLQVSSVLVKIVPPRPDSKSKLRAKFSVTFFNSFTVKGIRLNRTASNGFKVIFPASYTPGATEDDPWNRTPIVGVSSDAKSVIEQAVLKAYDVVWVRARAASKTDKPDGYDSKVDYEWNKDMEFIPEIEIIPYHEQGRKRADVTLTFSGVTVYGLSLLQGKEGLYVAYPSFPTHTPQAYSNKICSHVTQLAKDSIEDLAIKEWCDYTGRADPNESDKSVQQFWNEKKRTEAVEKVTQLEASHSITE